MRSLKFFICLLALALGMGACNSDEEQTTPLASVEVTTGISLDVGLTSAVLQGTVSGSAKSYTEVGICYSQENSSGMNYIPATDIEHYSGNSSFSVAVNGLIPDANYTYCAYAKDTQGNIINAEEQKSFRTCSPAELLEYNRMQWVALRDATLCWDLSECEIYSEVKTEHFQMTFGMVWSLNKNDVIPSNNQFSGNTRTINFNQGSTATLKLTYLSPSTRYYYATFVNMNGALYVSSPGDLTTLPESVNPGTAPSGVVAVDLGLPSGVLWANMNVGAEKEEDPGLFFAWGETEGYLQDGSDDHRFDWATYKWCKGSRSSQTKYCTNSSYGTYDNKVNIDLTDDAAYINWGENWRMPTNEEMKELVEMTDNRWTTQNGVEGYVFISHTNGKSIFLPAAGCRVSESNYEHGTDCYYWAGTLDEESPYAAHYLRFYVGKVFLASLFRYYGMNVRPVRR